MKKLTVMTIVGTRPEIIRLSALIPKLDEFTNHILVHTGQNSDIKLNDIFFDDLALRKPDHYLNVDTSSFGSVMGDTIKFSEKLFRKYLPDALLILGDTNSSIAAVVAERMQIPVYHMEAGNRSFDLNVPEELNRRLVDHVSSFNLPYNGHSMRNLLHEGIHPRRICVTGSPMGEILDKHKASILSSRVMRTIGLAKGDFVLASIHRQENVDDPNRLNTLISYLSSVQEHFRCPIIVSTHPRTRARLAGIEMSDNKGLRFMDPFGYLDYCNLQMNAKLVVSDSGTVAEESAILGFPAVTLRESMERPEALHAASLRIVNPGHNLGELDEFITNARESSDVPEGYEVKNFSWRVLNFVLSTAPLHSTWLNLKR